MQFLKSFKLKKEVLDGLSLWKLVLDIDHTCIRLNARCENKINTNV